LLFVCDGCYTDAAVRCWMHSSNLVVRLPFLVKEIRDLSGKDGATHSRRRGSTTSTWCCFFSFDVFLCKGYAACHQRMKYLKFRFV